MCVCVHAPDRWGRERRWGRGAAEVGRVPARVSPLEVQH